MSRGDSFEDTNIVNTVRDVRKILTVNHGTYATWLMSTSNVQYVKFPAGEATEVIVA